MMVSRLSLLLFVLFVQGVAAVAEQGMLQLQVLDTQNQPLRGVILGPSGAGNPGMPTDSTGRTRVKLPPQTRPTDIVELDIDSPRNKFVFISPWDQRLVVPAFDNQPQNFVRVTLGTPGDRNLLSNDIALRAMANKVVRILSANGAHDVTPESKNAALRQVAQMFGMTDSEVDTSIRNWGTRIQDPYDKGIAALYEGNYSQAQQQLQVAVNNRGEDLQQSIKKYADSQFALGQSFYLQGKYKPAADAFRETLKWRPGDPLLLNNLALNLAQTGNLKEAETFYRQAVDAQHATSNHDPFLLSQSIGSLGGVLMRENRLDEAEPLLREAVTIRRQSMPPDDPRIATSMNNLAVLLQIEGKLDQAQTLLTEALAIQQRSAQQPGHCSLTNATATCAALISETQRGVIPQTAQSAISQSAMSANSPIVLLPNAAGIPAFDISEKSIIGLSSLAQQRPGIASTMCNLAMVYVARKVDLTTAESLVRQAIVAEENTLPSDHPDFATSYEALGTVLAAEGESAAAKAAFEKALEIRLLNFGPDHIYLIEIYESLSRLEANTDAAAAIENLNRALRIEAKVWGDTDPRTQATRSELASIRTH